MLKPTSGKLYMLGEKVDAGNYKLWDKVGYLEEATFYPDLTVIENLDIARRMQAENPERLAELLVKSNQPPTLLRVITEDLEGYFLRKIGMVRGNL